MSSETNWVKMIYNQSNRHGTAELPIVGLQITLNLKKHFRSGSPSRGPFTHKFKQSFNAFTHLRSEFVLVFGFPFHSTVKHSWARWCPGGFGSLCKIPFLSLLSALIALLFRITSRLSYLKYRIFRFYPCLFWVIFPKFDSLVRDQNSPEVHDGEVNHCSFSFSRRFDLKLNSGRNDIPEVEWSSNSPNPIESPAKAGWCVEPSTAGALSQNYACGLFEFRWNHVRYRSTTS